jgi:hypothetical protein
MFEELGYKELAAATSVIIGVAVNLIDDFMLSQLLELQ